MSSQEDPDARVLSYYDVLLRRADLDLLKGPEWLNDQLIHFYFTYILEELHPGLSGRVCLMPPGTTFLLLNSDPSDSAVIFEALQLHKKDLVVFAVNDNPDVDHAAGGSHWSCLCFHQPTNTFRHYDSSPANGSRSVARCWPVQPHPWCAARATPLDHQSCLCFHRPSNTFRHYDSSPANGNRSVARMLAGAATPLVRSKSSASGTTVRQTAFEQVAAMPSQQNGYDCGLYLCAAAQAMCGLMVPKGTQQAAGATAGGTAEDPVESIAGGTAAGTASSAAASTADAVSGSTAEAGSGSKRNFEEHEFGAGEDSKGLDERQQEQARGGVEGSSFEEREREVLQSISSSSVDQLRQHMLELIEERAAQQQ